MGFFDDRTEDGQQSAQPVEQRAWDARNGPPEGWVLPVVLPWVRVLGESDKARIALVGVRCWPAGVGLTLHVLRRWAPPVRRQGLEFPPPEPSTWAFRFGLRFADGRTAIAPNRLHDRPHQDLDGAVRLRPCGGGGSQFFRHHDFYLWPVPPIGRLTLVVDWPAEQIPETHTELDATEIRSGTKRARVIWPDLPTGDDEAPVARRRRDNDRES